MSEKYIQYEHIQYEVWCIDKREGEEWFRDYVLNSNCEPHARRDFLEYVTEDAAKGNNKTYYYQLRKTRYAPIRSDIVAGKDKKISYNRTYERDY